MNQNVQTKQDLRAMLDEQVRQYQSRGNEITRYASLSSCNLPEKIKLTTYYKPVNLKQQEWDEYLNSIKNGTYQADSFKQEPIEATRRRFRQMTAIDGR